MITVRVYIYIDDGEWMVVDDNNDGVDGGGGDHNVQVDDCGGYNII